MHSKMMTKMVQTRSDTNFHFEVKFSSLQESRIRLVFTNIEQTILTGEIDERLVREPKTHCFCFCHFVPDFPRLKCSFELAAFRGDPQLSFQTSEWFLPSGFVSTIPTIRFHQLLDSLRSCFFSSSGFPCCHLSAF